MLVDLKAAGTSMTNLPELMLVMVLAAIGMPLRALVPVITSFRIDQEPESTRGTEVLPGCVILLSIIANCPLLYQMV